MKKLVKQTTKSPIDSVIKMQMLSLDLLKEVETVQGLVYLKLIMEEVEALKNNLSNK